MALLSRPRRAGIAAAACAAVILAGCGASPTDTPQGGGASGDALANVYAAVEGKTGQDRFDTLLGLAREEAKVGPFGFYHSGTFTKEIEAFQNLTGLKVGDFEATSERVAERVVSEHQAGRPGSAVVLGGGDDMSNLYLAGGLAELDTPMRENVSQDYQTESWISPIGIMEMPTYNSEAVSRDQLPRTWEDFFTNFDGRIGIELTDWSWYGSLIQRYFVEQKGMTEDAAIKLVTDGLRGASTVDGHTLTANLLASGQYDYVPNAFAHYVPPLAEEGAPITYDGLSPDMPPFFVVLGAGITKDTPQPASALLFIEFLLSEQGQTIINDRHYVPTSDTYQGETLLEKYPHAITDAVVVPEGADVTEVQNEWKAKFDELLRQAGTAQVQG
jgi:iron(III) transport system substrate-binding protein